MQMAESDTRVQLKLKWRFWHQINSSDLVTQGDDTD